MPWEWPPPTASPALSASLPISLSSLFSYPLCWLSVLPFYYLLRILVKLKTNCTWHTHTQPQRHLSQCQRSWVANGKTSAWLAAPAAATAEPTNPANLAKIHSQLQLGICIAFDICIRPLSFNLLPLPPSLCPQLHLLLSLTKNWAECIVH